MSNRFHSAERLKSRKEIGGLFKPGNKTVASFPLRIIYGPMEERRGDFPVQVTFVVPKRKFKRAVDRNLLKRRMREAYRLNKELLGAGTQVQGSPQIAMLIMYTGKEELPYKLIERKMRKLLESLRHL